MKSLDIGLAKENLAKFAESKEALPLVITKHGRPVATVLPVSDADMETVSLCANPKFIAIIERSRERYRKEGGISSDEICRRLEIESKHRKVSAKDLRTEISRRKMSLSRLIAQRNALNRRIAELECFQQQGRSSGRVGRKVKS